MTLNSIEWSVLSTLRAEKNEITAKCPQTEWNMSNEDMIIVDTWMSRRIGELEKKLKDK